MVDKLYKAAIEYQKLKNISYNIILGRKGNLYNIVLYFPEDAFFHLAGLQHLKDITFPSTNKERIYKEILKGNITIDNINRSVFYEQFFIEERLENFEIIQKMIESNMITYLINPKEYVKYSKIKADYLCEYIDMDITYLFLVKESITEKYKGCSLFTKHDMDYTRGAAKTTTLLIGKSENNLSKTIYRSSSYKE